MSTTHPTPQNGSGKERITDLRDLDVGDRVVFADYVEPRTVTELGVRELRDERIDATLETPLVRVEGERAGAKTHVLAHVIDRLAPSEGRILEETEQIIAAEDGRLERGTHTDVVRVSEVMADV